MVICLIVYVVLFGLYYRWRVKFLKKMVTPLPDPEHLLHSCGGYIQEIYTLTAGFGFKERVVTRYRIVFLYGEKIFEVPAPGVKDLYVGDIIEVMCSTTDPSSAKVPLFHTYQLQFIQQKTKRECILLFLKTVLFTFFIFEILKFLKT